MKTSLESSPAKKKYQPRDALPRSVRRVAGRAAAALAAEAERRQEPRLPHRRGLEELAVGHVGDGELLPRAHRDERLRRRMNYSFLNMNNLN